MPLTRQTAAANASTTGADIFLALKTKRAGAIKGESKTADFMDAISIDGWHWGVAASSALGSSQATGRRSYKNLVVRKRVDSSTTALMSVLTTNDEVKEAKLSMRKAGEGQRPFFMITLANARVIGIDMDCDDGGDVVEQITFSFNKVQVDYELQQADGQRGAGFNFQDEILAS